MTSGYELFCIYEPASVLEKLAVPPGAVFIMRRKASVLFSLLIVSMIL